MCYSAQIIAEYRLYVRMVGADINLDEFVALYWLRAKDRSVKIPKAIDAWFAEPRNDKEAEIKRLIDKFNLDEAQRLEQELFKQRKRLADAKRKLQNKPNLKGAADDVRVATKKIAQHLGWLNNLRRKDLQPSDARVFPGWYVPVIVMEQGRRVVRPMRYQCRPAGMPANFDKRFPGTYNARRDNLRKFWKELFGFSHGLMLVRRFFENVDRVADDGTKYNVTLEFTPQTAENMLVACLWSAWKAPGQDPLLSFAAITDDPPPEVAAAGHDRCIVPIKPDNVDAWLTPQPSDLAAQYTILDDRPRPYYEHRLAA